METVNTVYTNRRQITTAARKIDIETQSNCIVLVIRIVFGGL